MSVPSKTLSQMRTAAPMQARDDDYQQALDVLRGTRDGDDLEPHALWLVQCVVNNGRGSLSKSDRLRWNEIVDMVARNAYVHRWLHGVEHLTKTQQGYVRWKGQIVEHYSFAGKAAQERSAALRLGACCRFLEAHGREVNGREVLQAYEEARLGLGLQHQRHLVTWYTGAEGAKIGVEPIDGTRVAEVRALIDAAVYRRRYVDWGHKEIRALTVVTREDFQVAVEALTQSCDWARHSLSFLQYSNNGHLSGFLDTLHRSIAADELPTEAQVFDAFFAAGAQQDEAYGEAASSRPVN